MSKPIHNCDDCIHVEVCEWAVNGNVICDNFIDIQAFKRSVGEWLWVGFDGDKLKWSCSLCGRGVEEQENYCPKCGAKMILDEEVQHDN